MKVLIVGNGGREHALAWKISQSPLLKELYCVPGNAGTAQLATNIELDPTNTGALALWAVENKIDLTIVGPEAPLAEGIVDVFTEHGLKIFGPTRAAARLEWSKAFSKEIMLKAGVPTAKAGIFSDFTLAKQYVEERGAPIVIKADGLCAGKGVVVAESVEEAIGVLEEYMARGRLGRAGQTVVIEERLVGEEASVIAIVDGHMVIPFVVSQDFKRVFDGDQGPNTGGMGAISPTPVLGDKHVEQLVEHIYMPVLRELWGRGIPYVGFLYAGVMVDRSGGVRVLEFNCRLGDPETQVLMMRLRSDLLATIAAAMVGDLASVELKWTTDAAACVVGCSEGYPGEVRDGREITGIFPGTDDLQVFLAGVPEKSTPSGRLLSKGGRILSVTALGESLDQALKKAYSGMEQISLEGMHYRRDIGVTKKSSR